MLMTSKSAIRNLKSAMYDSVTLVHAPAGCRLTGRPTRYIVMQYGRGIHSPLGYLGATAHSGADGLLPAALRAWSIQFGKRPDNCIPSLPKRNQHSDSFGDVGRCCSYNAAAA